MKGIDISSYEKGLKLGKDLNFVILRAGFTGWGGDGTTKYKDETFEGFYKQAKDLNLPVGCYWFSCANSYDKGKSEAIYMYENCLKGKQFDYPIYIDVEDMHHQKNNKRGVTDAIKGFCDYLESKNYYVGIYGSDISTFQEMVYINELTNYDKWVARYGSKPKYVKDYQIWQYSCNGNYSNYTVDLNECNYNYPKIIKEKGFNGYGKTSVSYKKGDSNETIEKVDDYLSNKVKGNYFGDYTEVTLNLFKSQNGLSPDGIIDDEVLKLMGIN
jgi:GH25 family lysozyme M1 (1,4-beta-N-acetylmuramidase)